MSSLGAPCVAQRYEPEGSLFDRLCLYAVDERGVILAFAVRPQTADVLIQRHPSCASGGHHDQPVAARWSLMLRPDENPDLSADEGSERQLDLGRVEDLFLVLGYRYRLT